MYSLASKAFRLSERGDPGQFPPPIFIPYLRMNHNHLFFCQHTIESKKKKKSSLSDPNLLQVQHNKNPSLPQLAQKGKNEKK